MGSCISYGKEKARFGAGLLAIFLLKSTLCIEDAFKEEARTHD